MQAISIVTDSTADLPVELVAEYEINIVRNLIILQGKNYRDGEDISREEFYNLLPGMNPQPTTATASSGTYHQLYESLLQMGARYILSIHPPLGLSGIFNAANTAAQAFGDHVHVVDSGQVSLGLGFQVMAAAEAIRQGAGLEGVLKSLTNMHHRVRIIAMLDTLEYVRRSGRVSWARARLGNFLQIKPFIQLKDGIVSSLGESRTRGKGIQRLKDFLYKYGSLERLAILHTNAEGDARRFLSELELDLATPPLVVNVTTVIGTHVGPNGLGFAAVARQDW
jgi:DegV family protein with EDD domain